MQCPQCGRENRPGASKCKHCHFAFVSVVSEKTLGPDDLRIVGGRYALMEQLATGGMGTLWKAQDTKLRPKIVAIKILRPRLAHDKDEVAQFQTEVQALASLRHPNIVPVIDQGREGDEHYFVMEWIDGEDLHTRITQGGPLALFEACHLMEQICAGLDHAHGKNIYHCDLKPSNVLVDSSGNARIVDFGLTRMAKMEGLPGERVVRGTPPYMPPEQRRGFDEVDQRGDIYSLGKTLFFMLTGRRPPSDQIALDHFPSKLREEYANVATLLRRATDSERLGRPRTVHEFWQALKPLMAPGEPVASPDSRSKPGLTPHSGIQAQVVPWWRKVWVLPLAIVALTAATYGIIKAIERPDPIPQRRITSPVASSESSGNSDREENDRTREEPRETFTDPAESASNDPVARQPEQPIDNVGTTHPAEIPTEPVASNERQSDHERTLKLLDRVMRKQNERLGTRRENPAISSSSQVPSHDSPLLEAGGVQVFEGKPRVAVMFLRSGDGFSMSQAQQLTGMLEAALAETGVFELINRTQIEEIARNHDIELQLCTQDACYLRLGGLLGAQKLVVGDVGRLLGQNVLNTRLVDLTGNRLENEIVSSVDFQGGSNVRVALAQTAQQLTSKYADLEE